MSTDPIPAVLAELKRLKENTVEPKCPLCSARVGRPKCMFELDPEECPRHDLAMVWRMKVKKYEDTLRNHADALIDAAEERDELLRREAIMHDFAERECGHSTVSSQPWQSAIMIEMENLRRYLADARRVIAWWETHTKGPVITEGDSCNTSMSLDELLRVREEIVRVASRSLQGKDKPEPPRCHGTCGDAECEP